MPRGCRRVRDEPSIPDFVFVWGQSAIIGFEERTQGDAGSIYTVYVHIEYVPYHLDHIHLLLLISGPSGSTETLFDSPKMAHPASSC